MKRPINADFVVRKRGSGVDVTFNPTLSHYSYSGLADGGLSRLPHVRHAKTGDTGEYLSQDIEVMAFELASKTWNQK